MVSFIFFKNFVEFTSFISQHVQAEYLQDQRKTNEAGAYFKKYLSERA